MAPDESETPAAQKRRYVHRRPGALPDPTEIGLQDEIRMMRLIIRRVMNLADEGRSLAEVLRVLDSVGAASTRLARLLKAEGELDKKQGMAEALSQALAKVTEDLKLY